MKTKTKECVDCGAPETESRRRCAECLKIFQRKRVKEYYDNLKKNGKERLRYGKVKCCVCEKDLIKNRPDQVAHGHCKRKIKIDYNSYPRDKTGKVMMGRRTVLNLGIKLTKEVIVHHIDENPINNSLKNMIIMSRKNHITIHSFLKEQWYMNYKIHGKKLGKMWKSMLVKLNFIWMENKTVIKLDSNKDLSSITINKENIYIIK